MATDKLKDWTAAFSNPRGGWKPNKNHQLINSSCGKFAADTSNHFTNQPHLRTHHQSWKQKQRNKVQRRTNEKVRRLLLFYGLDPTKVEPLQENEVIRSQSETGLYMCACVCTCIVTCRVYVCTCTREIIQPFF